jgi:hypothetical protein
MSPRDRLIVGRRGAPAGTMERRGRPFCASARSCRRRRLDSRNHRIEIAEDQTGRRPRRMRRCSGCTRERIELHVRSAQLPPWLRGAVVAQRQAPCVRRPEGARQPAGGMQSDESVASTDYKGWSLCGAPWLQPVATGGKSERRGSRENKPKLLPWVATACRLERMVSRASAVGCHRLREASSL